MRRSASSSTTGRWLPSSGPTEATFSAAVRRDRRRYVVSQIPDLGFWRDDIGVPGEPFCLLLLCGDEVLEAQHVESFASRALRQGMLYLSVWGTAAEWVEDLVDQVYEDTIIAGELN